MIDYPLCTAKLDWFIVKILITAYLGLSGRQEVNLNNSFITAGKSNTSKHLPNPVYIPISSRRLIFFCMFNNVIVLNQ